MIESLYVVAMWSILLIGNYSNWYGKQYAWWRATMECNGYSAAFWLVLFAWDRANRPSWFSRVVLGRWDSPLKRYLMAGNALPDGEVNDSLVAYFREHSYFAPAK